MRGVFYFQYVHGFIKNVVQDLIRKKYPISDCTFILPNKRSGLFLKREISRASNKTIFSPLIYDIDEFMSMISGVEKVSETELLFDFYKVYEETTNVDKKESEGVSESANNAEPEIQKQETEPEVEEPEPEVKEIEVSMSSLVVEENGKFSVSQSPRESVSSAASSQIDRSKKNDVNPDYRSPYALSDDQKKRLRKRERAKQRKLREDAEAEKIQKQEIEVILFE